MCTSDRRPHNLPAKNQRGSAPRPMNIDPVMSVYGWVCPVTMCVHCGQFSVYVDKDPDRTVFQIAREDFLGDPPEQLGRVLCPECGKASWDGRTFAIRSLTYFEAILGEGRVVFPVLVRTQEYPKLKCRNISSLSSACRLSLEEHPLTTVWITMGS